MIGNRFRGSWKNRFDRATGRHRLDCQTDRLLTTQVPRIWPGQREPEDSPAAHANRSGLGKQGPNQWYRASAHTHPPGPFLRVGKLCEY